MGGTVSGGQAAAKTNKEKYGADFYQRISLLSNAAWVRNGRKPRGFSLDPARARTAGAKGGTISRRGKSRVYN